MDKIGDTFLDIPKELLYNILLNIPKVYKLKLINKKFMIIITNFLEYYYSKFDKLVPQWRQKNSNVFLLIKTLIDNNKLKELKFLINNTFYWPYIAIYALQHNKPEIMHYLTIKDYNELVMQIIKNEYVDLFAAAVDMKLINIVDAAVIAAETGKLKILQYTLRKGVRNYDKIIDAAVKYNNFNIITAMVQDGLVYFDNIAYAGAKYGNLKAVKYAFDNDRYIPIDEVENIAKKYNNFKILDYLFELNVDNIAIDAARTGDKNMLKAVIKKISNINAVASTAAKYNKFNIVRYALKNGATNVYEIAQYAADRGNLEIFRYLADNYDLKKYMNELAVIAAKRDKLNIVVYALEHGATNEKEIKRIAKLFKFNDILDYLE